MGSLRLGFYVASMDQDLNITFPTHPGYRSGKKAIPAVSYSPKLKAAIRKQMLRDFRYLASIPTSNVDPAIVAKLQAAAQ